MLALFLILYGFFRFLVEFVREPDTQVGLVFLVSAPSAVRNWCPARISARIAGQPLGDRRPLPTIGSHSLRTFAGEYRQRQLAR
jgi:hypothetical protein